MFRSRNHHRYQSHRRSRSPIKLSIFLILLIFATIATWAAGLADIQYRFGQTLAFDNDFPGELDLWEVHGGRDNVQVASDVISISRVSERASSATQTFALPPPAADEDRNAYKVRVDGQLETLKPASEVAKEEVAAYMIWFLDDQEEPINYITVEALTHQSGVFSVSKIVSVPSNAAYFTLAFINRQSDGEFNLIGAKVRVVLETQQYKLVAMLLLLFWCLLLLMLLWWLFRRLSLPMTMVITLMALATMVGVLLPESAIASLIVAAWGKVQPLLASTGVPLGGGAEAVLPFSMVFKFGHFVFFFLLSLFLFWQRFSLKLTFAYVLVCLLLFVLATEGMQLHLSDRTTRVTDMVVDTGGILLAALLVQLVYGLVSLRASKKQDVAD